MPAMTSKQVGLHLETLPNWAKRGRTIHRTFVFAGFLDSIDFVKRVARQAQRSDHHPDMDIRFNKVTLVLTTHTEGGLTGKDFALARQSEDLFARYFAA
jgi:4a-hydroxytetrahydrobiopterin dehydratase